MDALYISDWAGNAKFAVYAAGFAYLALMILRPFWIIRLNRHLPAVPEDVWRLLIDLSNAAYFNPETEKIDLTPDADDSNLIWCTVQKKGRKKDRHYAVRVVESTPNESMKFEFLKSNLSSRLQTLLFELTPSGPGTQIRLTARVRLAGPVSFFFVRRFYARYLDKLETLAQWA